MFRTLLRAGDAIVPLFLRLGLGAFGMFHVWVAALVGLGEGPTPYTEKLARDLGVPAWLAVTEMVVLVLGGLLVLLGWCTRIIALLIAVVIVVIFAKAFPLRSEDAFTIVVYLLAALLAISLVVIGGGRGSLDRLVETRQRRLQATRDA